MALKGSELTTSPATRKSFSCAANVSYTLSIVVALASLKALIDFAFQRFPRVLRQIDELSLDRY